MSRLTGIALLLYVVVMATSCGNIKNLQYLQGTFDTVKLRQMQVPEPLIQKGDLLGIAVYSDNALATLAVTQPAVSGSIEGGRSSADNGSSVTPANVGFLVSQQGDIQLFKLGFIHVEGMNKRQLADTLARLYVQKQLLANPYVDVRFLNYKVTLIGEVNRPGTYTIPTEKITAFEAIGLAGDITSYGRRDNVLIVRELNGVRQFGWLDFSKPDVFLSPYYYLQQNDMIIVDVARNKAAVNDQITIRNITVAASILSTIAIFINIFRR
jgi:polysaccharide biosynthesis/export protein